MNDPHHSPVNEVIHWLTSKRGYNWLYIYCPQCLHQSNCCFPMHIHKNVANGGRTKSVHNSGLSTVVNNEQTVRKVAIMVGYPHGLGVHKVGFYCIQFYRIWLIFGVGIMLLVSVHPAENSKMYV